MKLSFNIDYRTNWGESIYICGDIPALGNNDPGKAVCLNPVSSTGWGIEIEVPATTKSFAYRYFVRNEKGYTRHEWGHGHVFTPGKSIKKYNIIDYWQDMPGDKPFYSSAFTECICRRDNRDKAITPHRGMLTMTAFAPMIASDEVLAITGGCEQLGNWDTSKATVMNDNGYPLWSINIDGKSLPAYFEYKFLILKKDTRDVVAWEASDNRRLSIVNHDTDSAITIDGLRFVNPYTNWKGAGVAIPVFSLRSEDDFGAGDFFDLMKMVDWAVATGQKFIQILPINDTTMTHTWTDSYPYNANSTFALHPMYLRITELGKLKDKTRREYFENLSKELNVLEEIDYERVTEGKIQYTREIFAQEGDNVLKSKDFKNFIAANESWLKPYAAFCVLRDRFHTPDFNQWEEYKVYDADAIARFAEDNINDINFVYYQQFHLDRQMHKVTDYAHAHGVAIKGDIPIGISRTSVDAWISPRLFNLDCQAGAPPDDFSVLGQNWGFPTYNWEEMSRDGFAWWKARFRKMAEYFDAYRIDHVLGFFRIWQIPMNAIHGLLGIFNPALPFTPEEMRTGYDFHINLDIQTRPYIMDWFLRDFFGEFTDEARARFLNDNGNGRYALKPEFDTQRKVADYFATQEKNDKNTLICNALMGLIDNVLFIEDPVEKGKYHPRISAQSTYIYRSLSDYEKWNFDRLYNDFFYRRHNDFWYDKAMWKLPPLIDATDMLTCAEDLGMIPDCVPAVMHNLEILSLEIQRMPKDPATEFGNTWAYPYYSVCTTSTHDMGGIRQWWEENREATQRFFTNVLHGTGTAPYFAEPWICEKIVDLHLKSPSMLCILPLQDWLSIDGKLRRENPYKEQINVPANSRHYWRYRMHLTLEHLLEQGTFNRRLSNLIKDSSR